jgi:hypothetical protein
MTHPTDLRDTVSSRIRRTVAAKAYNRIHAFNAGRAEPLTDDETHCWAAGFIQGYLLRRNEQAKKKTR